MGILTLCGSLRLGREVWDRVAEEFSLKGEMVFTVMVWKYDFLHSGEGERIKEMLDLLHKQKIERSDRVVVLIRDGYIGKSTKSEIEFAEMKGKPVGYYEC